MGISLVHQTTTFLFACGLGFALGIVYECFRVCRMVFRSKMVTVFFQDIIYFIIVAIATFLFCQVTLEGEIRFYVLLGEVLGWLLYYFSVGAVVFYLMKITLLAIRHGYRKLRKGIVLYIVIPISRFNKNVKLFFRKLISLAKKRLKRIFSRKPQKKVAKSQKKA